MSHEYLTKYIPTSQAEINRLLALPPEKIYTDPAYKKMISELNVDALQETMSGVHDILAASLPDLLRGILSQHNLEDTTMSAYTLSNWLVGYLRQPDYLAQMIERHQRIPAGVVGDTLPHILTMLDQLSEGRELWQQSLAVMALPLLAP